MIFILTFLMQMNLSIEYPEKYLGKSLSQLDQKFVLKKKESPVPSQYISYQHDQKMGQVLFLNKACKRFMIKTNQEDEIKSVFLRTEEMINTQTYSTLVERYGLPSQMIKMGKVLKSSKSETEEYTASSEVREAIHCSFDENPIFITWEKSTYSIHIEMDYHRKTSLITFKSNQ